MSTHIILDLEALGIQLFFNPKSQCLQLIKVYELTKCQVSYQKTPINAPSFLSLADIHNLFGPTIAGQYSEDKTRYIIQYPGTTFSFNINQSRADLVKNQVPDPSITFLSCFYIYSPNSKDCNKMEHSLVDSENTNQRVVIVHPAEGIEFDNQLLLFGDSPQKVISLLGRPQSLSVKTSNSNIYRRVNVEEEEYEFDYFFTYFAIGIDILFSVETHKIIKFILHTNFPNSPHFNLYNKCQYKIRSELESNDVFGQGEDFYVTPNMKWEKIQKIYGKCQHQPLVSNMTNANFQTNLYSYNNLIFEVMTNEYVSSVTMIK